MSHVGSDDDIGSDMSHDETDDDIGKITPSDAWKIFLSSFTDYLEYNSGENGGSDATDVFLLFSERRALKFDKFLHKMTLHNQYGVIRRSRLRSKSYIALRREADMLAKSACKYWQKKTNKRISKKTKKIEDAFNLTHEIHLTHSSS